MGEAVPWDPVCLSVVKMTDEVGLLIQPLLVRCQKNENPEVARESSLNKWFQGSKLRKGQGVVDDWRFMRPAEGKIREKQTEYGYRSSYCES